MRARGTAWVIDQSGFEMYGVCVTGWRFIVWQNILMELWLTLFDKRVRHLDAGHPWKNPWQAQGIWSNRSSYLLLPYRSLFQLYPILRRHSKKRMPENVSSHLCRCRLQAFESYGALCLSPSRMDLFYGARPGELHTKGSVLEWLIDRIWMFLNTILCRLARGVTIVFFFFGLRAHQGSTGVTQNDQTNRSTVRLRNPIAESGRWEILLQHP